MKRTTRRIGTAALLGSAVLCFLGSEARAQKIFTPLATQGGGPRPVDPNFIASPFPPTAMPQRQAAFNTAVLGNALRTLPPQAFGFNPALNRIPPAAFRAPVAAPVVPGGVPYGGAATLAPAYNPYTGGTSTLTTGPTAPYTGPGGVLDNYSAANAPFYTNPYLYPNYGGLYDPVNGYLTGVASVTSAWGQYQIQIQRAKLDRQQAIQAAIETRRKLYDEARYELMNRPDPEEIRVRNLERALDRARNAPPVTEIWSAKALNDLYRHVAAEQGTGSKGPSVPLDPEVLKHVNLSPQTTRANPGLLKGDGKLQWPLSLQEDKFKEPRVKIDQYVSDAVQQLKFNNPVDVSALRDMRAFHKQLAQTLNASIDDLSPTEFIRADRFLRQVGDALEALEDPNVASYFQHGKAKNVAELVDFMSKKGLAFAPAVPGDEAAYRALYNALRAFDAGMQK